MLKIKCKAKLINCIVLCTSTRAPVKSTSMRSKSWTFEKKTTPTYHSNPFFQTWTWTFENCTYLSLSLPDTVTVSHLCKNRDFNARQSDILKAHTAARH